MKLVFIDYLMILFYFILVYYAGFRLVNYFGKDESKSDFILAGRNVTLPFFVASLVATWYGNILGIGEFVYRNGIVAFTCFALPYYIAAVFFALYLSKRINKTTFSSIPEKIEFHYGAKARFISSIIILFITIPASSILMLGILIQLVFNIDLIYAIVLGTILSTSYIFKGGLKADILTNTIQFVFMYLGFGVLLFFAIQHFGFFPKEIINLPAPLLKLTGNFSWQYLIVWQIIALQTFVDPSFHQRSASAIDEKTAQNGIYVSILFWILFDFLTISCGLYAKAFLANINPIMSYPLLADMILPVFWKGVFYVCLLAIVMSTLESYMFLSGVTIGNDILDNLINKSGKISVKRLIDYGMVISAILGISLAIYIPSPIDLLYKLSSIAVPGLLFPLLISYSKKISLSSNKCVFLMLFSSGISLFWTLIQSQFKITLFLIIEPMLVGICTSFVLSMFLVKFEKAR
jgi:SSS family solute:Na+ symporter